MLKMHIHEEYAEGHILPGTNIKGVLTLGKQNDITAIHIEEVKLWTQVCLVESRSWINVYVKPEEGLHLSVLQRAKAGTYQIHGSSQSSVTPFPGYPMSSSGLHGHQLHT